jgi:hypothetical protein
MRATVNNKEDFIKLAKEIHGEKYNYNNADFKGMRTKVLIYCNIHNKEFSQIPYVHIVNKCGCRDCGQEKSAKNRTFTTGEFIEKAIKIHGDKYNYSKVNYIHDSIDVEIICNFHGESFYMRPNNHIHKTIPQGCPKCGHLRKSEKTISNAEEFIEKARIIHGDYYDYSKVIYLGSKKYVEIICPVPEHGSFWQKPNVHLSNRGCKLCGYARNSLNLHSNTEEFIEKAKIIHGDKYDYSKVVYVTSETNVIIHCYKHDDFNQKPNCHINGKSGCPKCAIEDVAEKLRLTKEEFIEKAIKVHGDIFDYSKVEYINIFTPIIIGCKKKGHGYYSQSPSNHLQGWNGCNKCKNNISKTANKWLELEGVPNDTDHREVRKLIPGRQFIVDGYMPETNTVYEFYGDIFHGNPKTLNLDDVSRFCNKTNRQLYEETLERERMIREAGYNIIVMWESDFFGRF